MKYAARLPSAAEGGDYFTGLAAWSSLADVRRCYPSADMVRVGSGKPVLVFNVCGNTYRLIVAMHFDRQTAYTPREILPTGPALR